MWDAREEGYNDTRRTVMSRARDSERLGVARTASRHLEQNDRRRFKRSDNIATKFLVRTGLYIGEEMLTGRKGSRLQFHGMYLACFCQCPPEGTTFLSLCSAHCTSTSGWSCRRYYRSQRWLLSIFFLSMNEYIRHSKTPYNGAMALMESRWLVIYE